MKLLRYLKARLCEKSTYAAMVVAVTGGSALSEPYSYLAIALGIVGALTPSEKMKVGKAARG